MSNTQGAKQALLEIIASSQQLLRLLANDEPDTDRLNTLQQTRHQQITALFEAESVDLSESQELVGQVAALDRELMTNASALRDKLKAQALKHQKNSKASQAYRANR